MAKLLLENGAAVDAKDKEDMTALHWAAENGHEPVAKLLLENGAAVDAREERLPRCRRNPRDEAYLAANGLNDTLSALKSEAKKKNLTPSKTAKGQI